MTLSQDCRQSTNLNTEPDAAMLAQVTAYRLEELENDLRRAIRRRHLAQGKVDVLLGLIRELRALQDARADLHRAAIRRTLEVGS